MLKHELVNVLIVVIALIAATLLLTDRAAEDWRFSGAFLVTYLVIAGAQWMWRSRRTSS